MSDDSIKRHQIALKSKDKVTLPISVSEEIASDLPLHCAVRPLLIRTWRQQDLERARFADMAEPFSSSLPHPPQPHGQKLWGLKYWNVSE